ncbi:MAG: hypothetical protein FNP40_11915 [Dehalobacter sp. 4CP]|uniref:hypothetical protein n=1 Tax=unclassified Dehalobacter TaxID=2635733 RepID=UPI0013CB1538|nr:hypothetical protein [Dehalobacter sp.]MDJ0305073.1 hypothetical protein [Dehalobacter sp.]NBJ16242.1 hypothetical protein [Dehalobacter sp. 4CP]
MNLGQDADIDLAVGIVPVISKQQISAINVDADYLTAKGRSYDVLLDSNSDNSKSKFKIDFYQTYHTLLEKQSALGSAQQKLTAADSKFKISELKYKMSSISLLQYEADKSEYLSQQIAVEIAEETLTQAYRAYEWANLGLIVSAGY